MCAIQTRNPLLWRCFSKSLLFLSHTQKQIQVYLFVSLSQTITPIATNNWIKFHCFALKSNTKEERNDSKKKNNNEVLLFCLKTGLSIEYDEDNNTFQFINYLFVMILHHYMRIHMCISMVLSCSLVDGKICKK
ncbi:hypothetical protein RFI_32893 [Reticulomyxa filosa]|uniref:Uncharacterized protein n=1 Tax=Reticulomyxa filosa TaxID=46433 RepID=X6LRK3_RETFI|nr:hypothetical protein RFI_32893 [Reticulomyxa filosa]|eukprot:ETO04503.1 hypothetical protein RFI_32893 [Reticulomyxa filosa]